jgi:RsiW-degrading membrane proteinase PrsW (M82 family)
LDIIRFLLNKVILNVFVSIDVLFQVNGFIESKNDEDMASTSLYIALITAISFICFALSCSATFLPVWGYFEEAGGGVGSSHGYFSPWKTCKELTYNREKCSSDSGGGSFFRPSGFVYVSGIMIVVSTLTLGTFCVLSVVQIAAISQREKCLMNYSSLVTLKMLLAGVAGELRTSISHFHLLN